MEMSNGLREVLQLMPTEKLDDMLQVELQKKQPDAAAVNMILDALKDRESEDNIEVNREIQEAWEAYKNAGDKYCARRFAPICCGRLLRVASIVLVLGMLLFALPQEVGAKSLWDRFVHITDSIFEFFNPGDTNDHRVEYKFETDNPGLQEVYDKVVELGINDPVVPMWLPEGYELVEFQNEVNPVKTKCQARFIMLENEMIFQIEIYNSTQGHTYYKDSTNNIVKEIGGITHNVLRNNDLWVVAWTIDNVECFLTIDCQEEILYEIIRSIYVMEDE